MAYIGNSPRSSTFAIDTFSGDNTTVNFTLREAPLATSSIIVFVGGVRQQTDSYSLSSTTLVFSEAPPLGTNNVEVIFLGLGASASIPSDGSVSSQKILAGAVTGDKLASATITGNKITAYTIGSSNLSNTGVTSGVYGGSSAIPIITVDSGGRVTSAANVSVTGGAQGFVTQYQGPPAAPTMNSFSISLI